MSSLDYILSLIINFFFKFNTNNSTYTPPRFSFQRIQLSLTMRRCIAANRYTQ